MPRKPDYDKDDLIDRACDLFWKQGWAGTSLKDLERVLQMKPGSFYAAFGSKDALYALALDRYVSEGRKRLDRLAQELGPLKALQAHPHRVIDGRAGPTKACMLAKTVLELQPQAHALAQRANAHLSKMESLFEDLFDQAQTRGEIAPSHDLSHLARKYQSDLMGLRVTAERDGVDAKAIADDIADGLARL